ncbi:23S rRNA (uracil(747)-C(5))-methyltransferase [Brachybacterium endophyticum]|uniref:23S rRNA (Uracil(747)-C(5))-methyltransferase n=1 Tax=Brachybacterium endophyticum TaxID=2182385 RepID=A0A2U2RNF8_9MICO|nr:methyltransferase domain-containing protein [Brachybacterium endophyticum]PWH07335.1 23S rRNA (uracil(747)-C(5))-methyltransferase [Brachybacterium endophyticum]
MQCHHFDAGTCHSCTLLAVPHDVQIADASSRYAALLAPFVDPAVPQVWRSPVTSAEAHFRATAKMVATGTANAPVLGLLHSAASPTDVPGVDLVDCPLYPDGVEELLEDVRALIRRAQLPPYDVARRRGELKNVLVTVSPDGEFLLRLVLRTEKALPRVREHLPRLLAAQPGLRVVSANIHPEHKAVLDGPTEIHLAGEQALRMRMDGLGEAREITLQVRPRSFVQTNSAVASQLYAQVGRWIEEIDPRSVWDLYCGVGGFALHCADSLATARAREVTGVEISPEAIESARAAAAEAGLAATFHVGDATTWAIQEAQRSGPPQAVVVNPPRRGIGPQLAGWIEGSGVRDVVYSSCNPRTLAEDLAAMPSYRVTAARLVDMFPHTRHDELLVRLRRTPA